MKLVASALLCGLLARGAQAQCVIDAVTSPTFGSYDPLSSNPLDTTGSVTYRCLVALAITIDLARGASATYAARTMARAGGGTLTYNLFLDPARQMIWGDATGGTVHYGPVLGLLSAVVVPLFGRIPAGQDASVGSYSDTIVVTLNY